MFGRKHVGAGDVLVPLSTRFRRAKNNGAGGRAIAVRGGQRELAQLIREARVVLASKVARPDARCQGTMAEYPLSTLLPNKPCSGISALLEPTAPTHRRECPASLTGTVFSTLRLESSRRVQVLCPPRSISGALGLQYHRHLVHPDSPLRWSTRFPFAVATSA